jgi:hypothetical protein
MLSKPPKISPLSLHLFFRHKEEEKAMAGFARGRMGVQGRQFAFIASQCHNRECNATGSYKAQYTQVYTPH